MTDIDSDSNVNVILEMKLSDLTGMVLHVARLAYQAGQLNKSVDDTMKLVMESVSDNIKVVNATLHRKH